MSAEIKFSGNDTKVRINSVDPPREVNITGAGAVITNNPNSYDIVIAGTGTISGAANVGSGTGTIYRDTVAGVINLKSLAMGSNKLALTNNANDITVDVTEANLNIANQTGSIGNARISDLAYSKLTGVPASFTPSAHKSTHVSGGSDAFAKTDVLSAAARYVETISDPSSDTGRMWVNVKDMKYWDNTPVTPVLQTAERQTNKGVASGYCDLDGSTLVPLSRLSGITTTQISASAAILKSQLASLGIVDADVAGGAAIAKSKLAALNIGDADTATFTTTKISTLSKTLLNTAIVYNDQNNNLGAFYVDIATIAAPANPSAGSGRLYVKTIDANNDGLFMLIKKNAGFVEVQIL